MNPAAGGPGPDRVPPRADATRIPWGAAATDDAPTIGHHLQRALQVGAPDAQSRHTGQVLERDGMRVAVLVVNAAGDERDRRVQDGQHLGQRARVAAVMPDLEDVDAAEQAALQQPALHGRLGVAGQQRSESTAFQ